MIKAAQRMAVVITGVVVALATSTAAAHAATATEYVILLTP